MDHAQRLIDHEARLIYVETIVERLDQHHRGDKLMERITDLQTNVALMQEKLKNGNGKTSAAPIASLEKRVRWLEWIVGSAIGGFLVIKWAIETFK